MLRPPSFDKASLILACQEVQVQIHLAGTGIGKSTDFEVNGDETPQQAMKKRRSTRYRVISDTQAFLPGHKGEAVTDQELFEAVKKSDFEISFRILILQSGTLGHVVNDRCPRSLAAAGSQDIIHYS
jgi:hypothetical protein